MAANYFTGNGDNLKADASLNITYGNKQGASTTTDHSVRVTTGVDNQVTIDICGLAAAFAASSGNTMRVRMDTYDYTGLNLEETYISPPLYFDDICLVAGNVSATPGNIGAKHKNGLYKSPLYYRTICGDGIDAAGTHRCVRVTMKEDVPKFIKNGKHMNIFTQVKAPGDNFDNDKCDISFTKHASLTPPQVLVNGGPLGVDDTVPPFSAVMVKTTGTKGQVRAFTSEPLFKDAGAGIDLSSVTFRCKDTSGAYDEFFNAVSKPTTETKNADGLYQYDVSTIANVGDASVVGKSFRVIITGVGDAFDVSGYAMQKSTNEFINLDNKPAAISSVDFAINADSSNQAWHKEGKKAIVNFKAPSAPEGQPSIKKYEARWVTKAQADVMKNLNFDLVKAAYPNQVNENTDICDILTYAKGASTVEPKVILNLPSNSVVQSDGSGNDLTRYGVFVRAFTKDDNGAYVAGAINADVSTSLFDPIVSGDITNTTGRTGVSLGFFVSAAPAVPTHIAVRTGKDLLRTDTFTANDTLKDTSMNNHIMVNLNDYNVDQRGSNYTNVKYAVVRAKDAQYGATLPDICFNNTDVTKVWDGNDAKSETFNISGASMLHTYNTTTNKWDLVGANEKDLSNGEEFAVSYAFDNSNGLGQRSAWYNFTPNKMTDTSLCLFSLDPSNHLVDGTTNSGFGSITGAVAAVGREISNNATYIGLNAAEKATMKVTQNNSSVGFGFSLLDASNTALKAAGKPYDTSLSFSGGLAPNSIRYFVNKSVATNASITDAVVGKRRRWGQAQKDVSGYHTTNTALLLNAAAQNVAATRDTDRLVVSQGRDVNNALTNLKLGQRYDICFGIQNANGFNDLSLAKCSGFAPMGEIKALNRVRINPATRPTPVLTQITAGNAQFDVCFNDLCGAAQHGGHVITHVHYEVTQYQGELSGNQVLKALTATTLNGGAFGNATTDFFTDFDGCSNNILTDGTNSRGIQITTNNNNALAGYPMKLTIYGKAGVISTNRANADLRYDNYLHNIGGVDVCGVATVLNIPGPTLGNATDDVRSLQAIPDDKKIKVSFFKPLTSSVADQYQGSPSVNAYHIYQYDMSLSAAGLSAKSALSRTVKVINDAQTLASDFVETELDGINGKGYVVAVHTQWRYGVNNDSLELSKGVYSSDFSSAAGINDPSQNTPGPGNWKLPAGVGALTLRSGASTARATLAVPRGVPSIEVGTNSLVFRDNGDELTVGSMIQISPTPSSTATQGPTAFYLDLCGQSNQGTNSGVAASNAITAVKVNGHDTNSKIYTVSPTLVLGPKWSEEQNFIVIQNTAGSAYVKRNIN